MTKILVIEDEELLRHLYSELLEMKGYDVATAEEGKSAIAYLNQNANPDLILLDINMPQMDGVEFLRIINNDNRFRRVPVIVLTGVVQVEKIGSCLSLGAVGYIEKANSPVEVMKKIELILAVVLKNYNRKTKKSAGPKKMGV